MINQIVCILLVKDITLITTNMLKSSRVLYLTSIQIGFFLLDLSMKKPKNILMLITIGATNKNLGKSTKNLFSQCKQSHGHPKLPFQCVHHTIITWSTINLARVGPQSLRDAAAAAATTTTTTTPAAATTTNATTTTTPTGVAATTTTPTGSAVASPNATTTTKTPIEGATAAPNATTITTIISRPFHDHGKKEDEGTIYTCVHYQ
jgi:hypothetical protein